MDGWDWTEKPEVTEYLIERASCPSFSRNEVKVNPSRQCSPLGSTQSCTPSAVWQVSCNSAGETHDVRFHRSGVIGQAESQTQQ